MPSTTCFFSKLNIKNYIVGARDTVPTKNIIIYVRGKMKTFCGTDIIEIGRIKKSIEKKGTKFINKIYTQNEIEYCESKKNVKFQHYAARFSAKEAIFKAISKALDNKFSVEWKN